MFRRINFAQCMHLCGKGLYALARNSQGDIRELLVRCSGYGYYENDLHAHIVIDGAGLAYTNVWDLKKITRDRDWRIGRVIVSLLCGLPSLPKEGGPLRERVAGEGFAEQANEKQLNSLAHVLAILCLGLRLTTEEITVSQNIVGFVPSSPSAQSGAGDRLLERVSGGGVEPADELIKDWTSSILEEMKNGLYPSIDPKIAEPPAEELLQIP